MMFLNAVRSDDSLANPQLPIQSITVRTYSYGFIYLSKKSRAITKIKDYVCAEQAKVQGTSGPRKVIDLPSLGRRIRTTSRSICRTAQAAHTNPEPRQDREGRRPYSAREVRVSSDGSDYQIRSDGKAGFWRSMLCLFQVYSTGPAVCTI